MALTSLLQTRFDSEPRYPDRGDGLRVGLATSLEDVRDAQRLRWQVFVEEMGARPDDAEPGIESDRFDPYCQHLLVREARHNRVVGCYRILTDREARRAGGFYSQTEFDLAAVLALPGRRVEVGRTCVHPDYRNGAVIGLLWAGLARYMLLHRYDYLMGCASIPLTGGTERIGAVWHALAVRYLAPPEWRVFPKLPFPSLPAAPGAGAGLPPLLKGYLRLGAQVCGAPAWDPAFNVADVFLLLSLDRLNLRYARHFLRDG